jgi:hypothetical protein
MGVRMLKYGKRMLLRSKKLNAASKHSVVSASVPKMKLATTSRPY